MEISLDNVLAKLLPWELVFTFEGNRYPTEPPRMAVLGMLMKAAKLGQTPEALDMLTAAVQGIFVAPGPDTSKWLPQHFIAVGEAFVAYFHQWQAKNSQSPAVPAAAAGATAKTPTTSGSLS